MTTNRLDPKDRRALLLQTAVKCAERDPNFTFRDVAEAGGVTVPLVIKYLGNKTSMLRHVMREAIAQENVPVVARGLVAGNAHARKAPDALRERCQQYLSERVAR